MAIHIDETAFGFTADGGTGNLTVTSTVGDWYVSGTSWVTVLPSYGTAGSSWPVQISVGKNTGGTRSGVIRFTDGTYFADVAITQAAGTGTIVVTPANIDLSNTSGTTSLEVTSSAAWNAEIVFSAYVDWLSLSETSGISGSANIDLVSIANTTIYARTATLRFFHTADTSIYQYVNVSQAAGSRVINIEPPYAHFTSTASSKSITLNTNDAWKATITTGDFISLDISAGSTGTSTVNISVEQNGTGETRQGWVRFYHAADTSVFYDFEISQSAAVSVNISVDPNYVNLDGIAGSELLSVQADAAWSATVIQVGSWLSLSKTTGSSGLTSTIASATANTSLVSRTATVRFYITDNDSVYQDITIAQAPMPAISIFPESLTLDSISSSKSITLTANTLWKAEIIAGSFFRVFPTSGDGLSSVSISAEPNTSTSVREGSVRFLSSVDNSVYVDLPVKQAGAAPTINIAPELLSFNYEAQTKTVSLSANAAWSAEITQGSDFISLPVSSGSEGASIVEITVLENKTDLKRYGNIRFKNLLDTSIYTDLSISQIPDGLTEQDGITIRSPKFGWAFNPIIIECLNPNNYTLTVAISGTEYSISKPGNGGKTNFDLSGLSQVLFNRDEFYKVEKVDNVLYKKMRVSFSYTVGSSTTLIGETTIGVLWGGLQIGETFSQNRTYRYFKGYPFTIPLYLDEKAVLTTDFEPTVNLISNSKAAISVGGSGSSTGESVVITSLYADLIAGKTYTFHCQTDGVWGEEGNTVEAYLLLNGQYTRYFHMNTNPRVFTVGVTGRYFLRLDSNANIAHSFWQFQIEEGNTATSWRPRSESETLDPGKYNLDVSELFYDELRSLRMTTPSGIEINIEVCDCCLGNKYLRYINHRGEWNYYLWKQTSESIESESSDIVFEQYYDTVNYVNNHHAGTGQYIGKQGKKILNLAAINLDSNMYDFVKEITLSPIVDLYMGDNNWLRVSVEDADLTEENKVLQHLEIEISIPNIIIQNI